MRITELFLSKPERRRRAAARQAAARGEDPQAARDAVDEARKDHAKNDAANAAGAAEAVTTIGPGPSV